MAGDWAMIGLDLPDEIEIQTIIELTDEPLDVVCGRMLLFWLWVNKSTTQPFLRGITVKTLSRRFGGDESFWRAVAQSGWLILRDDGIEIPGYEKWFSTTAKMRAKDAKRKFEERNSQQVADRVQKMSRQCPDDVQKVSVTDRTKDGPIEENRREENKKEIPLPPLRTDPEFDPSVAEVAESLEQVAAQSNRSMKVTPTRKRKLSDRLLDHPAGDIVLAYRWLLTSPRAASRLEAGASIDTILDAEKTANYIEAAKDPNAWKSITRQSRDGPLPTDNPDEYRTGALERMKREDAERKARIERERKERESASA